MLTGIDPLLTGELLLHLDGMGHSDAVVVADAHFPAERLGQRVLELPGLETPRVVRAIRSVLPLDDAPAVDLMAAPGEQELPVQLQLVREAGVGDGGARYVDRFEFYELAAAAYLIIRTGETRVYGNALLRKGVVR